MIRRGMTLLEIVLAMGILVLVSGMTFWFYSSALTTSRKGTDAAYRLRLARVVLDRIATEIRQATAMSPEGRVGIRGEPEHIWLTSYRVPSRRLSQERSSTDEPPPAEYDLTRVEYKIARHPDILDEDGFEQALGLARVEALIPRRINPATQRTATNQNQEEAQQTPDTSGEANEASDAQQANGDQQQDNEQQVVDDQQLVDEGLFPADEEPNGPNLDPQVNWEELYAPELRYLRFCYFDGHRWWDKWEITGESPLPQLVMVTIGFTGLPPFGEGSKVTQSDKSQEKDNGQGRSLTPTEINDEFCTCLDEDPVTCVPLGPDQLSTVVRVPQADPLFRSRVSRETQALVQDLSSGSDQTNNEEVGP